MPISRKARPATLSIRIGTWFEACATGWGVAAVPLSLVLALAASLVARVL